MLVPGGNTIDSNNNNKHKQNKRGQQDSVQAGVCAVLRNKQKEQKKKKRKVMRPQSDIRGGPGNPSLGYPKEEREARFVLRFFCLVFVVFVVSCAFRFKDYL